MSVDSNSFSFVWFYYGIVAFCTALLQNIYLLYHVDVYLNVFKVDRLSFWLVELIFLVWNSFNDYIFAWISDRNLLSGNAEGSIVSHRLWKLKVCGPLLSLTFLLVWFPWIVISPALQFLITLCLYDSFLTMVDLHSSSLQADISLSTHDRSKLNLGATLGSACASISVFVSYLVWDRNDLTNFKYFVLFIAIVAIILYIYSCQKLKQSYHNWTSNLHDKISHHRVVNNGKLDNAPLSPLKLLHTFSSQLFSHGNFLYFCSMQLIQVFHCHFNSNFFPLFLLLVTADSNSIFGSILLAVSFIFPHLNNIYFLILCEQYGVYNIIKVLFSVKIISGLFIIMFLPTNIVLLSLFILSNRMFTEGICKLLNLITSDLVDEDFVRNHRKAPVSALIFGSAALLSKPGQTFAPLLGTYLLTQFTGKDLFLDQAAMFGSAEVQIGCLRMLGWVPFVCGIVQYCLWSRYNLHGQRLQTVKIMCQRLKEDSVLLTNV